MTVGGTDGDYLRPLQASRLPGKGQTQLHGGMVGQYKELVELAQAHGVLQCCQCDTRHGVSANHGSGKPVFGLCRDAEARMEHGANCRRYFPLYGGKALRTNRRSPNHTCRLEGKLRRCPVQLQPLAHLSAITHTHNTCIYVNHYNNLHKPIRRLLQLHHLH